MKRIVFLLALAACTEAHDPAQVEIDNQSCTNCHSANLQHPETLFPLMSGGSMHTGIECYDCHRFSRGPGMRGFHIDCTGLCHLQTQQSFCCGPTEPNHIGRVNPNDSTMTYAWDSTNHDFCLSCHPQGFL
jgi:hypothetical protein